MTNYYSELKLSPDLSVEEIKVKLLRLEQTWRNREINAPETATAKLALINEAKKVFSSSSSKAAYDRELEQSRRKPVASDSKRERYAQWRKWYDAALEYVKKGQYDLAKTAMEKAISFTDPDMENADFFQDAARIARENKDYGLALTYINKALVIDDSRALFYITKGLIYSAQYEDPISHSGNRNSLLKNEREMYSTAITKARQEKNNEFYSLGNGLLAFSYCREIRGRETYYAQNQVSELEERIKALADEAVRLGDTWGLGKDAIDLLGQVASLREKIQSKLEEQNQERIRKEERRRKETAEREAEKRKSVVEIINEESDREQESTRNQNRLIDSIAKMDFSEQVRNYAQSVFEQLKENLRHDIHSGYAGGVLEHFSYLKLDDSDELAERIKMTFNVLHFARYDTNSRYLTPLSKTFNELDILLSGDQCHLWLFKPEFYEAPQHFSESGYTFFATKWGKVFIDELIRLSRKNMLALDFVIPIEKRLHQRIYCPLGQIIKYSEAYCFSIHQLEKEESYWPCILYELTQSAIQLAAEKGTRLQLRDEGMRPLVTSRAKKKQASIVEKKASENRRRVIENKKKIDARQKKIDKLSLMTQIAFGVTIIAIIVFIVLFIRDSKALRAVYERTGTVDQTKVRIGEMLQLLIILGGYIIYVIIEIGNYIAPQNVYEPGLSKYGPSTATISIDEPHSLRQQALSKYGPSTTVISIIAGLFSTWVVSIFTCGLTGKLKSYTQILESGAVWKMVLISQFILLVISVILRLLGRWKYNRTANHSFERE